VIIRDFQFKDIEELKRIHKEGNYELEYPFEVFSSRFSDLFSVVDDDDKLISSGGVRLVPEIVVATDKSQSARVRREALVKILQIAEYITRRDGHQGFTASTDDEKWYNHLLKYGFVPSKGKPLYYSVI
jgi:hypothetical protein